MYEKVLVAIDRSENSNRALAAARELASLSDGEVQVLHLREYEVIGRMGGVVADESAEEAHLWLESAVDELRNAGVKVTGEVRNTIYGQAAREIVADARLHDVGVIVMGSRGRSDLTGLFLGSTAHKVIHLTDRPVLVVR
jgi:nucleotide-binding universal stress UspA family protein